MWQDQQQQQGGGGYAGSSYYQPAQESLQFYSPGGQDSGFYPGSRPSLDGQPIQGSMTPQPGAGGYGGSIQGVQPWWTAFGTGGLEGEPPLLDELGINFAHIRAKSLTVLNPWQRIDERIMDDADLAGPLLFCFCFAFVLLCAGKSSFSYIYGVGLLGSISIYTLLNLMSETPIDAYRVSSVLGYCLLPMVGVGALSIFVTLKGIWLLLVAALSISWCTYAASGIFVTILRMSNQRLLVAYPVGMLYGCFAMLSVFSDVKLPVK